MSVRHFAPEQRQPASFAQAMDFVCKGHLPADASVILGPLDIVFGEAVA